MYIFVDKMGKYASTLAREHFIVFVLINHGRLPDGNTPEEICNLLGWNWDDYYRDVYRSIESLLSRGVLVSVSGEEWRRRVVVSKDSEKAHRRRVKRMGKTWPTTTEHADILAGWLAIQPRRNQL